ncbi:energy-coupled thiamine transporter ThiT [Heyndrickxia ginsengihumi]|uniref:Energy-coupled thiamine transporter ThiT n=1 Tax=Heyndrickxia ginsengihumi TaxID=363870 RepID=A0A0A6VB86_9BACI|nr:energy-coupled thiamine transporter ThiT [Heyndrickxia ginsengihumi]KHD84768.1 proton-coupled thiamine transporter YuaJ [Heyndrickxia ginsengihumi]MBE6184684.1 energy-coupled thiamine transporter ThiT [Bacillus sp. (in: firmicutes)]MCM3023650.1 energy-coupled thiamine transporter ThiT [Heyndrickxia ginsengihumi]NEY19816.1 energy-coupled thiamine transporter ThiT [Heyndrickxia ginsengihumi]
MKKLSLQEMIESAIFAAFAMMLDLVPSLHLPGGIEVSFAMVPIFIVAFRWGFLASFASGLVWGLLQIVVGDAANDILNPIQGIIEYFIAFACIGFAGMFKTVIQKNVSNHHKVRANCWIVLAVLVGCISRYIWHFIAGVIYWGSYAPKGQSPVIYSLIVNGGTMIGNFIICSVISTILASIAPHLLKQHRHNHQKVA